MRMSDCGKRLCVREKCEVAGRVVAVRREEGCGGGFRVCGSQRDRVKRL